MRAKFAPPTQDSPLLASSSACQDTMGDDALKEGLAIKIFSAKGLDKGNCTAAIRVGPAGCTWDAKKDCLYAKSDTKNDTTEPEWLQACQTSLLSTHWTHAAFHSQGRGFSSLSTFSFCNFLAGRAPHLHERDQTRAAHHDRRRRQGRR